MEKVKRFVSGPDFKRAVRAMNQTSFSTGGKFSLPKGRRFFDSVTAEVVP
jgi:hypothetical protein